MKIAVVASYGRSLTNLRGTLIKDIVGGGHEVLACAPDGDDDLRRELLSLGAAYRHVSLQRNGMNPVSDLGYLFRLCRLFQTERVDLALGYSIKPVVYGSIAARMTRVTACSLIPGLGYTFMAEGMSGKALYHAIRNLYTFALSRNKCVFFQNPDDRALFLERGIVRPSQAVLVNGSGVDLNYFHRLPLPEGPPTFILVARLIRPKGVLDYFRAAELLRERFPQCRFLLAGPFETGPHRIPQEEVKRQVAKGVVEFLGEVADIRTALRRSTVFVLPSWYREGIPRSILEAMATGRPIITTDSVGCRETVVPGENGFLVPPGNPEALAKAMTAFVLKADLAQTMGENSRKMAEEKFDVNLVNRIMIERLGLTAGRREQKEAFLCASL